jgi:hypothetical protein
MSFAPEPHELNSVSADTLNADVVARHESMNATGYDRLGSALKEPLLDLGPRKRPECTHGAKQSEIPARKFSHRLKNLNRDAAVLARKCGHDGSTAAATQAITELDRVALWTLAENIKCIHALAVRTLYVSVSRDSPHSQKLK